MLKEAFGTGKTVEEARDAALAALEVTLDDEGVTWEIVERPEKKVLGLFGGSDAKVRVIQELPDGEKPRFEGKNRKNRGRGRNNKQNRQNTGFPAQEQPEEEVLADRGEPLGTVCEEYLKSILALMGAQDFTVTARKDSDTVYVYVEGSSLGNVIGRRGETMDALQQLMNIVNRRDESTPGRVVLDVGGYRAKREAYLKKTARSAIDKAVRYSRNVALEPMNAYERRYVHTIVQQAEGVSSKSVGEDPYRKVIISSDDAPEYEERRNDRGQHNDRRRNGRNDRRRNDRPVYEREKGQPIGRRDDYVPHAKRDVSMHKEYGDSTFGSKANDGELFSLYEKIEPRFPARENVEFVAPVEENKDEE